jgi:hypothetical protein
MALFAVLLTSTWGIASALEAWQDSANQEAGTTVYSDDAIGTGTMPGSSANDSSVSSDVPESHESLGTGSMDESSSGSSGFFTPLGVDPRPGIDGN